LIFGFENVKLAFAAGSLLVYPAQTAGFAGIFRQPNKRYLAF